MSSLQLLVVVKSNLFPQFIREIGRAAVTSSGHWHDWGKRQPIAVACTWGGRRGGGSQSAVPVGVHSGERRRHGSHTRACSEHLGGEAAAVTHYNRH